MNIVRKALIVFLAGLLSLFLFLLALNLGIMKVLSQPQNVKTVLADSGIYKTIVPSILDSAETENQESDGLNLSDPAVKQAAERTFTPEFLQQNTEHVIDSLYRWLDGKSAVPDFRIDVTQLKTTFAAEASKIAEERARSLPQCPPALSGGGQDFDVFSATCLPRGATPASVAAQVRSDILSGEGFIKDDVITANSVKSANSSGSIFENELKDVPQNYRNAKMGYLLLVLIALLLALAIVFLSSSRTAGLRRVGIVLLIMGFFVLVFGWGLVYAVDKKVIPELTKNAEAGSQVAVERVSDVSKNLVSDLSQLYYILGGIYMGLGALAIGGPILMNRRGGRGPAKPAEPMDVPEAPVVEPVKVHKPAPKPPAKKPKPPTKINVT